MTKNTPIDLSHISTTSFSLLFKLSKDAYAISIGAQGRLCPNPAFCDLLGYSEEELCRLTIRDITPKKWLQKEEKIQKKELIQRGFTSVYEKEYLKKDGSTIPVELQAFVVQQADNFEDYTLVTIAKDLSEKRILKEFAKQSEHRYQLLSEATFEAILVVEDGICIEVNVAAEEMFGYSVKEIIGRPCSSLVVVEDRSLSEKFMYAENEDKYTIQALRKDGSRFPAEIQGKRLTFKGKSLRIVALTDISKRIEAEKELRKNEKLLREAQEIARLGSYEMDYENDVWHGSEVLNSIFGIDQKYEKDSVGWLQIVHPEDQAMMEEYFQTNILTNHEKFDKEYRIIRLSDKKERWVHGMGKLTFNKNGKPAHMTGTIQDITNRKLAVDQVRKSEERHYLAAQAVKLGHFDWLPQLGPPHWDSQMRKFFGLDDQFDGDINEFFNENLHPEDKDRVTLEFIESMDPSNEKTQFKSQFRILLKSGVIRHLASNAIHFKNSEGVVTRIIGTCLDITERMLTKTALEQSESKFRSFFENNTAVMLEIIPDKYTVVDCNQAALDFYGYSRKEFKDFPLHKLNAFGKKEIERLMILVLDNKTLQFESKHRLKNGEIRDVEASTCLIHTKNTSRIFTIITDISERKKAKLLLEESKDRLQLATQTIGLGCYDWHLQDGSIHWDSMMHKIFNLPENSTVDKNEYFFEIIHPDDKDRIQDNFTRLLNSKTEDSILDTEFSVILKNGKIKHIESRALLFKTDNNEIYRVIGTCLDITDRKNTEEQLLKSEDRLSLIYNSTSDYMILLRVEKNYFIIESVNHIFQNLKEAMKLEADKDDLVGMHVGYYLGQVLKFEEREILFRLNKYDEVIRTKKPSQYLGEMKIGNKTEFSENTITPIFQDEKVTHLLWVSRDVTETVLGARRLERAFDEVNKLKSQLERENIYLREEIELTHNYEDMVFASSEFQHVLSQTERVAVTDANVFIHGETGTGKELIARAIHNISSRKHKPMIKLNCAAIPRDLIESELFGHERGAFTGAAHEKLGKFELAHQGTLFLDEIGELPLELQSKLLRALQEGEIERVGGTKTIKVDVRIISASNKDLKAETEHGNFREDLYFRLIVFPITIPPLRERPDDIPVLVDHFANKFAGKLGKKISYISDEAMQYLQNYDWPGNVRELENLIERSIILSNGECLEIPEASASNSQRSIKPQHITLNEAMRSHIQKTLAQCNWKIDGKNGAAELLDMKPSTLRDKMKKLGVKRPAPNQRNTV